MKKVFLALLLFLLTPVFAGDLKVTWKPNTEPDLAGYYVYYGKANRTREHRILAGKQTQYVIQNLEVGETYYISVTAVDTAGNESAFSEPVVVNLNAEQGSTPQNFLLQSHPNPFRLTSDAITTIGFELYEPSHVKLEIFNLTGQRVITLVDKEFEAGAQKISWNGRNFQAELVGSGVYLYRLEAARRIFTRKLIVYH